MDENTTEEQTLSLPRGFTPALDVIDGNVARGKFVNVIAVVKDCRLPMPTAGADYKCTLRLFDISTEYTSDLVLIIFRPQAEIPEFGAGDVVVLTQVKVQCYANDPLSLLTNKTSGIYVYDAATLPKYPNSARLAQKPFVGPNHGSIARTTEEYISWMYKKIDKQFIPDVETFKISAEQSLSHREKFSLLQNVAAGKFYDLVVQITREPYDLGDKMTLWVTDYTENMAFYNFEGSDIPANDPYGYGSDMAQANDAKETYSGPFGQRIMQVTCYEPHATAIRDGIHKRQWVRLRNVQVKYGFNDKHLEGFLREDRRASGTKIGIMPFDPIETREDIDPKLKGAFRQKMMYEKERKLHSKGLQGKKSGLKRRASSETKEKPPNTKERRAMQRAQKEQKTHQQEKPKAEDSLGLNTSIVCENLAQPLTDFETLLARPVYHTTMHKQSADVQLPFVNAKYRLHVRVIDFYPPKLEDFAWSRKPSEYEILSEFSASGLESDGDESETGDMDGNKIWEWRFALRLQDASSKQGEPKNDVWAVVDNADAQLLTGLDACNLRTNEGILNQLRERLFVLWGDLEENKAKDAPKVKPMRKTKTKPENQPPPDSSDAEGPANREKAGKAEPETPFSNRPFSCCIKQYGIKVNEPTAEDADAGDGKRWSRAFGLFGVKTPYI